MVDLGLAFVLVALPIPLSGAAPADSDGGLSEIACDYLVEGGDGPRPASAPELRVLERTAEQAAFAPAVPDGARAIRCARNSIIPGPHDEEVLAIGLPFYIFELNGSEPRRVGVLERSQGQFRFRMLEGRLRPAEQDALIARLNRFQLQARGAVAE